MTPEFVAVLNRIAENFRLLAEAAQMELEGGGGSRPPQTQPEEIRTAKISHSVFKKIYDKRDLREHYSKAEADDEMENIESSYRSGLISWDKKRGMKMLVTKRTEGWTPDKTRP
jgi:hypothetical protein